MKNFVHQASFFVHQPVFLSTKPQKKGVFCRVEGGGRGGGAAGLHQNKVPASKNLIFADRLRLLRQQDF
jgi:hypothetical protein